MKTAFYASLVACLLVCQPASAADWLSVRETSLEVQPGSPLDFSGILQNPPIDDTARIVNNSAGKLATVKDRETPLRFLCASLAWSPASGGFPDHQTADLYAAQLKMHGYNIARFHYVDAALMEGRSTDFDINPEVLDRIHYLMAVLKRNGIYWIMDGLSSSRGAYGGFNDRWEVRGDLKLGVQIDDADFDHWLKFQKMFLANVNPYTGIAPIRDPALVAIVPFNENGLEFDSMMQESERGAPFSERLKPLFNAWLVQKYGTSDALIQKWGRWLTEGNLDDRSIALPTNRYERSELMRDLQSFFTEVEHGATAKMTQSLRDLGFQGIILPYNNWPTIQTGITRSIQDAVAMNTYQDWVNSYAPGTEIQGKSSLEDGLLYLRTIAAARWFGRPFFVTEYDHLFWNPYRYEAGLAAPAFAALQDWDVLCRHAHGPIVLSYGEDFPHKKQMLPYAIALDPVARAGETLAALVFRRGDLKSAALRIPFLINGQSGLPQGINDMEPEMLTRLGLLGAIGLQSQQEHQEDTVSVDPVRDGQTPASIVSQLKQRGELQMSHPADLEVGHVLSQTQELQLDAPEKTLALRSPMTEALAFDKIDAPFDLGFATVQAANGRGLFAISSLDGQPLEQSKRMLLILASDAHNTDMKFRDAEERIIEDFGRLPVMIRRMDIGLHFETGSDVNISPIGLDGRVHPVLITTNGGEATTLTNDVPSGPTTYFLVERN
ncbi:glycoside hydrolase [Agrobacterium rosae]|uniref:Glycoside hydrolase n=1 Tax=Agrobacterium rosae TaxID=1972867 RepID=A0AAE5VNS4_9HYPH|nr:glycoside hydrolase [Agrobacterium rosae]KAA3515729.1 glycoside hydrolase [Agrobacterium rosae]KAA3524689.1 glycoside hydrolase [Agrobacterium rosae]MCM2431635.1 glycoside hydrolase [Agrobacterium rosae]MDX8328699.1 glycoside hydrolase [Agrobacterium rosae]MQB47082.1 glycoside hydrolase [Agrobacterium rosae]